MLKIKRKIAALLMISIMCAFSGCDSSSKYVCKSGNRVEAWQKDLDYLKEELPKKHKNLFFKLSKDQFNSEIEGLKQSLNKMNDDQIQMDINKIMTSIGDGHTGPNISSEKAFPLDLYWFSDGIYAINTTEEYSQIKYNKLAKINDKPIEEVIKSVSQVISHDNEQGIKSQIGYYIVMPSVLHGLNIIENMDSCKFTFEDSNGKISDVNLKPLSSDTVFSAVIGKGKEGEKVPLYMKNQDKAYWYEYLKDSKTVYFSYNKCSEMQEKGFKQFSKELMDVINKEDVKKLVIDMRSNGGGISTILNDFIKEISKSKLNEKGKLYVITGRRTFSSAVLNVIDLKKNTKAIFVGEPTSGKPNHYGEVKKFKLPNSGLTIKYSTKHFNNYDKDDSAFNPDKEITVSIKDYVNNVDPVMDYIIKSSNFAVKK